MNHVLSIQHFAGKIKSSGWSAMREAVTSFVRRVLETVMSLEQQEQMGCQPYERSGSRRDYANGTYQRILSTTYGVINDLTVPRLRRRPFTSRLLQRYKRRARELDCALLVWYLQGESCRDVTRSLHTWAADILSAQSVSRLLQTIDRQLQQWRERPLPPSLVAVWLDGFSVRVRVKHKVRSYTILAALGRHPDGRWEMLSFRLSESESEQRWMELLHQMYRRGMRTQLFIHDGAGGIAEALRWDYPAVNTQRCLIHKLSNILDVVATEEHRQALKHDFWLIYNAATLEEAQERFHHFCRTWNHREPRAVRSARADWNSTMTFFSFPDDLRTICRSTNMFEWVYHELRRRVKVIGAFPTPQSCERIIFLTLMYIEEVNLNKSGNMLSFFSKFTQN
jgi:transposase-like protein